MTGYTDTIRQWATDSRRSGIIPEPDGIGEVGLESHEVGRRLAVRFTLKVEHEKVSDVRFQVFGCGFTIAACAVAADLAAGSSLTEIAAIDAEKVNHVLQGLPDERSYCAELAVEALLAAVKSVQEGLQSVTTGVQRESDHGACVTAEHPVYAALMESPKPAGTTEEDRHLFACLIAAASDEPYGVAAALGLTAENLEFIREVFFPSANFDFMTERKPLEIPPESSKDILEFLLSHVSSKSLEISESLARILTARAAHPGHLWVAMGLFERPQLSAAIRRHLPTLAAANNRNMRWKRFFFKQVCDLNGGTMCRTPNCGECSDYSLCFIEG